MPDASEWTGLLQARQHIEPEIEVVQVIRFPEHSMSGAFYARCSDGKSRYIKTVDNPEEVPTIPLNEYLVGKLGELIGAPVCQVELIRIGDQLRATRPDGMPIAPGVACGSLEVGEAILKLELTHRELDQNRARHCAILALCEWCAATDHQWLAAGAELEYHSHDHGRYFTTAMWPESGNLIHRRDESFLPEFVPAGLDVAERDRLVATLRAPLRGRLLPVLQSVPGQWPIENARLESLGEFLEHRAVLAATMLERLHP